MGRAWLGPVMKELKNEEDRMKTESHFLKLFHEKRMKSQEKSRYPATRTTMRQENKTESVHSLQLET